MNIKKLFVLLPERLTHSALPLRHPIEWDSPKICQTTVLIPHGTPESVTPSAAKAISCDHHTDNGVIIHPNSRYFNTFFQKNKFLDIKFKKASVFQNNIIYTIIAQQISALFAGEPLPSFRQGYFVGSRRCSHRARAIRY